MKKLLLSMACLATFAMASAADVTYNVKDATDIKGEDIPEKPAEGNNNGAGRHVQPLESFKLGGYTFACALNAEKGTAPAYYWSMSTAATQTMTVRLYKDNTMTVTAPEGTTFGKMHFKGSNGKAGIVSADKGTATSSTTEVTWENSEAVSSVTFSFTGSFRFTEVTFSTETGEAPDPNAPVAIYNGLESDINDWTIDNVSLPEGSTFVWKWDSSYNYAKASSYVNKVNLPSEALLVSPEIDLAGYTDLSLSFEQVGNFFKGTMTQACSVLISVDGGAFEALNGVTWPEADGWDPWKDSKIDLNAYAGKKIKVAFKYTSTSTVAGTWEVKNFIVNGKRSTQTAITEVEADSNAPVEYFNLQGVRVANPENGLYIRRQGNKVTKVLVK